VLLLEDNKDKLKHVHTLDVVVTNEDTKTVKIMCFGRSDENRVRQILGDLAGGTSFQIERFETAYQLAYYEPPICIYSKAKRSLK
jgi:hypothetical protein